MKKNKKIKYKITEIKMDVHFRSDFLPIFYKVSIFHFDANSICSRGKNYEYLEKFLTYIYISNHFPEVPYFASTYNENVIHTSRLICKPASIFNLWKNKSVLIVKLTIQIS